jgi:hypothetical protein
MCLGHRDSLFEVRMSCRFYGKCGKFSSLVDQLGNECGLILHSYAPCAMEVCKEPIDESSCPVVAKAASYAAKVQDLSDADRAERWLYSRGLV